jgi:ribosome biogenesis GTPase
MNESLVQFGWNNFYEAFFAEHAGSGSIPARVLIQHRDRYILISEFGELTGTVSGKFLHEVGKKADFPAVGDWVVVEPRIEEQTATIHKVLERRTKFSRKVAGLTTEEQVVAANIDVAFLVLGLDSDFNLRRLERYLTTAWESGATPVVALNKSDLCEDVPGKLAEAESISRGVLVAVTSAKKNEGLDVFREQLHGNKTGVLLGSSGVGKSTIINTLLGFARQKTEVVRESDDRGRHTTTARELLQLPTGGLLVDTPGMRELQLWVSDDGLEESFDDIAELAARCKFKDCRHQAEPDCAVKAALESGEIAEARWQSYLKQQRELQYLALRQSPAAARKKKERERKIHQQQKQHYKHNRNKK